MSAWVSPVTASAGSWWELERSALARLAAGWSARLSPAELEPLRSLGDRLDAAELAQVLLPVAMLVEAYITGHQSPTRRAG